MDDGLLERMERLQILETDLVEKFVHGSGPGGQKINKTASCVYLHHLTSGIEVHCQESRSRDRNRTIARERLCQLIEEQIEKGRLEKARQVAKTRYARRKPSAAAKARLRRKKQFRSDKKRNRARVSVKNRDD